MGKTGKKIWSLMIGFVALLGAAVLSLTLPDATKAMAATGDIVYLAPVYDMDGDVTFENGEVVMQEKTLAEGTYSVVTKDMTVWGTADTSATPDANGEYWYVVNVNVTRNSSLDGLVVNGKVNLILCDGAVFNMTFDVITVGEGNEFTVYGQKNGTGVLNANTNNSSGATGAGIGGNADSPNAGKITINGGTVSVRGANNTSQVRGAGIGGANSGNGGEITINGGTVTAKGSTYNSAGIGGGNGGDSGTIVTNGGIVNATAGKYSTAIGASTDYTNKVYGHCTPIRIYGGNVTATGDGTDGAAIGGARNGTMEGIEIYGGEITTANGSVGLGIGALGKKGDYEPYVTVYGGKINTTRIGQADSYTDNTYPKVNINIHGGEVTASLGIGSAEGDSGQIAITGGKVIAYGSASNGYGHAAIGGGYISSSIGGNGYVTITGGYIEAYGGGTRAIGGGAGIGGAYKGHGIVSISGACIIAEGGPSADGIGDGDETTPNGVHLEFSGTVGGSSVGGGSAPTPDNPDLEESVTASTGAIVFTTGITGYSEETASDYTGIICIKYGKTVVYSPTDYVFVDDIRIPDGYRLTIDEGESLTLTNGKKLKVDGELFVQGTLALNNGASVEKGEITGAVSSEKDGEVFDGWYLDEALTIPFAFGQAVTEETILYPKFMKGITECNPDNGNIQVMGISVVDIIYYGGSYNGYTGTPKAYVTDNGGTYYVGTVSVTTHYQTADGEILSAKPINAGEYELVFTFTDGDDTDSVNCTGSIAYPFTIEKHTITISIENQILDTTDDALSGLNKTLKKTYTKGVENSFVVTYIYEVDFAWNADRTGVVLSNGRAFDEEGAEKTDNLNFVYVEAKVISPAQVTKVPSSATSTISLPYKDNTKVHVGYGSITLNSVTYYGYTDGLEWAYYIDADYSVPLKEGSLIGVSATDNVVTVTPDASQNTFTNNKIRIYYTLTCNGYVKKSYYDLKRSNSSFSSVAIYKDGEEITQDRLSILNGATATYTAKALDQYGYEMSGNAITWSVSEDAGVTFENGVLTVAGGTQSRTIEITATSGTRKFVLPIDLIGSECIHEETEYGYCKHCQVKIAGATVTVGEDLTMTYSVQILDETLLANISKIAMEFTVNDETTLVYAGGIRNGYYTFAYEGIAPQQMSDLIDARLMMIDGETLTVLAEKLGYSVKQNAQNLLKKSPSAELKQLLTDMLYYGSKAQQYRNYNVNDLATKGVTDMASANVVLADGTDLVLGERTEGKAYFKAAGVWFDNVNKLYVKVAGGFDSSVLTVKINGVEAEIVGGVIYTDGIVATDFDGVYIFALYQDGVLVHTVEYSIKSYVYAKQNGGNAMAELATALYAYGQSAAVYAATLGN